MRHTIVVIILAVEHTRLGSIGDRGVCEESVWGGGGSNSNIIIVLCVDKSRGQLSVSCY